MGANTSRLQKSEPSVRTPPKSASKLSHSQRTPERDIPIKFASIFPHAAANTCRYIPYMALANATQLGRFNLRRLREAEQSSEGYGVAFLAVIVCTLARYPLQSILDTRAPYAFYLPIVAFCAWRYGLRSAVACLALGAAVGTYLYVTPFYAILHKAEATSLFIYLFSSSAVALIGGSNRKAHSQLAHAREELRLANHELEERVLERTAALVEKNEELSSFTYTVAHDLRSAIRSLVVNSRVLIEDEGEKLGASGREQTERLYAAAMRLSNFVDDLLQYARTGNRPITSQRINLSEMFERQVISASTSQNIPTPEVHISPDLFTEGDPAFIALALLNLAENACKYRSPDRPLVLEFGRTEMNNQDVFFVKDNGMGFDPQFSTKIFEPFERLHRYADIPGTGIGLANVKRAIERHSGTIWADGELGNGAVFYFTLGKAEATTNFEGLAIAA